jgi:CsoR family transcriptional regulator, copper-sensing transcriptional repressor
VSTEPAEAREPDGAQDTDAADAVARKGAHIARLRRVEGQVRGLERLVSADTECIDVLTQVAATTRALQSFAVALLADHLSSCIQEASADGSLDTQAKVAEATAAIARLMRA